jgi:hypothetical protein
MRSPLRVALVIAAAALAAAPPALAGFAGTDLFLPMVGRQAGVYPSNWYTTVWVHNPGNQAATAAISFLERNTANPSPPSVDVLVGPGDTQKLENVVESLFHRQGYGALRVTCATQKLVVTSRVYSKTAGEDDTDSMGQDFAGVPASFAIGLGERTQVLGVHQTVPAGDSEFRFNFGFVETTGSNATVRVSAFDENGAFQASKDFQVLRLSQRQVAFKDHFPTLDTENTRLEVEVISGNGRVIAYGSMIANGSQDPTTFEMEYPANVLAENATPGVTGVIAGAGLTGGGAAGEVTLNVGAGAGISVAADTVSIANGGVTAAMLANASVTGAKIADGAVQLEHIDTTGAAAGQVLKVGSAAHWADDGLALPFAGTASAPLAVLDVINSDTSTNSTALFGHGQFGVTGIGNPGFAGVAGKLVEPFGTAGFVPAGVAGATGAGTAVSGNAISGTGIMGQSASGTGILGESLSSYGIHGRSTSGDGVFGEAAAANKSGVFAVNDNPGGWAGFFRGRVGITAAVECTGCIGSGDLAAGAVTKGTLAAAGGAAGQVLGTDGSALVWQTPAGLTLPYSGITAASGTAAFSITNTSSSPDSVGLDGRGASAGVAGISATGKGIKGESLGNVGVIGLSSPGTGVVGLTESYLDAMYYKTGVLGMAATGTGVRGESGAGAGVHGKSVGGIGVRAESSSGRGMDAESTHDHAVYGTARDGGHAALIGDNSGGGTWGCVACGVAGVAFGGYFGGSVGITALAGSGNRAVYSDAGGVLTNSSSDARLKRDVVGLAEEIDVLAALARLRGVAFNWDTAVDRARGLGDQREIGMVAQEVEAVLPHLVGESADGYKTLDYAKLTAFLVEVTKAQQREIDALRAEVASMRERKP